MICNSGLESWVLFSGFTCRSGLGCWVMEDGIRFKGGDGSVEFWLGWTFSMEFKKSTNIGLLGSMF